MIRHACGLHFLLLFCSWAREGKIKAQTRSITDSVQMQIHLGLLFFCYRFALAVQTIDVKGASFVNSAVTTRFSIIGVE